jgi:diadenosine tetraphosphatase ApaH/serine/threonine PP2A family protein phosphatase
MRIAVVSDIHSNLLAFQEVLADIDRSRVDRVVSLGDNIGYGPEPESVLRLLRTLGIPSIMGNHELGIADPSCLSWFNNSARRSLEMNAQLLSPASIAYTQTLAPVYLLSQCLFVHGFPPDSITTYLSEVSDFQLRRAFASMDRELCFVGHTHDLHLISFDGLKMRHAPLPEGSIRLPEGSKYLINAGSVGQPRDSDNRSKYLIWDSEERRLEARFLPYDIAGTVKAILALGLPRINADRLW